MPRAAASLFSSDACIVFQLTQGAMDLPGAAPIEVPQLWLARAVNATVTG